MRKTTWACATITTCTYESFSLGTSVRQQYACTDVETERGLTLELSVLYFWCPFYRLGMWSSAVLLMIHGNVIRDLRVPAYIYTILYLSLLYNPIFKRSNMTKYVPCLTVALPSMHSNNFVRFQRQKTWQFRWHVTSHRPSPVHCLTVQRPTEPCHDDIGHCLTLTIQALLKVYFKPREKYTVIALCHQLLRLLDLAEANGTGKYYRDVLCFSRPSKLSDFSVFIFGNSFKTFPNLGSLCSQSL